MESSSSLVLLMLGLALAYILHGAHAQFSFSIPGQWGHRKRSSDTSYPLPTRWGGSTEKRAIEGEEYPDYPMPPAWSRQGLGKRMPHLASLTHSDVNPRDLSYRIIMELFHIIREQAEAMNECCQGYRSYEETVPDNYMWQAK